MAKIELRPCSNQFESEADYIEIPINDTNYLRIRKEYGHIDINGKSKRYETIYVKHMKQHDGDYDDTWYTVSETSYHCS
tara:strand:- start:72 stop:308 length:237 start_codon:yes stop_codon:yes gene_type:complete